MCRPKVFRLFLLIKNENTRQDRTCYVRYHAGLMENNRMVNARSLAVCLEQQKEKYTCPEYGGIILFMIQSAVSADIGWKISWKYRLMEGTDRRSD